MKQPNLFLRLEQSIELHASSHAFCISDTYYTYQQLSHEIDRLRSIIRREIPSEEKIIGLVTHDNFLTYVSIIALWFEGKAYVPLVPGLPQERCDNIVQQAGIHYLIDAEQVERFQIYNSISLEIEAEDIRTFSDLNTSSENIAYILFTSGTSGTPKGVPISVSNLSAFVDSYDQMGIELTKQDRCLQMFEMTFDVSVMSYLVPLLYGCCIYTIPRNKIKYGYIFELLEEKELTFTFMVPSVIHYLRPYFEEIHCPKLRYSLFAGEALSEDVVNEWAECVPNALVINAYGPTENTIICTQYNYRRNQSNVSANGILSIGPPMYGNDMIIVDADLQTLPIGEKGELCLAGPQLTSGYWNNEEKNKQAFFYQMHNGKKQRFYRSGDLCVIDDEGNINYLGRIDFQAKIQGYRVELSEVEFHVKSHLTKKNIMAIAFKNPTGNTELGLAIEGDTIDVSTLSDYLKTKIPAYMIPSQVKFLEAFPLTESGKVNRKEITHYFSSN